MTTIRKIVTSKIDGNSSNATDTNEIRPYGEISLYVGDNNKLELLMFDGLRTHVKSKVLNKGTFYGGDADSSDDLNRDTIKLVPDEVLRREGSDQYLVIDPTYGEPGHIHIRAGGAIDSSSADLFLGGELNHVRVSDLGDYVRISTDANNEGATHNWQFNSLGALELPGIEDDTTPAIDFFSGASNNHKITLNNDWTLKVKARADGANEGHLWLEAGQNTAVKIHGNGSNVEIVASTGTNAATWNFDKDGKLTFPGNLKINPLSPESPYTGTEIVQESGLISMVAGGDGHFMLAGWGQNYGGPGNVAYADFNFDPGNVRIVTGNNTGTTYTWTFSNIGTLTLANNTSTIKTEVFDNSGNDFNSIVLTPDPTFDVGQGLRIYPTFAEAGHLHLTANTSTVDLFIGNDTNYVKVAADGLIEISGNTTRLWGEGIFSNAYIDLPSNASGESSSLLIAHYTATGVLIQAGTDSPPHSWQFGGDGTLTFPSGGDITFDSSATSYVYGVSGIEFADGSTQTTAHESTSGSWTLSPGANTVSFTVDPNATYTMWVNGNIPNGIVKWNATISLSNPNVPALGCQYGWYYDVGNQLVLTSIPDQIVGTNGSISTATVVTTASNVLTFGITNNSGSSQVVNWGYTKI